MAQEIPVPSIVYKQIAALAPGQELTARVHLHGPPRGTYYVNNGGGKPIACSVRTPSGKRSAKKGGRNGRAQTITFRRN